MLGKLNGRSRLTALLAVAVLGLGAFAGFGRAEVASTDGPSSASPATLPVRLQDVTHDDRYAVREMHAGRVVSRRVSELGFERSGRLDEVLHDHGDRVEAGALLARLDTRDLRARRAELVASRDRIDADLRLAGRAAARQTKLHESGVASSQRLDEAVFAEESLASQRRAAVAAIEHLDVQLELSELRAPFAGVVAERFADEGTVLAPGTAVMRLLEEGALEVHVGLPAESATRFATGGRHPIAVGGVRVDAVLDAVLPTIDPDTRTVTAVFRLDDPPASIRHGALARVEMQSEVEADGFWVPLSALAEGRRGLWTAYVAVQDQGDWIAERRQLEIIHTEADRAYVRGALRDGERLVAGGAHRLVPGMRVQPGAEI